MQTAMAELLALLQARLLLLGSPTKKHFSDYCFHKLPRPNQKPRSPTPFCGKQVTRSQDHRSNCCSLGFEFQSTSWHEQAQESKPSDKLLQSGGASGHQPATVNARAQRDPARPKPERPTSSNTVVPTFPPRFAMKILFQPNHCAPAQHNLTTAAQTA